MEISVLSYGGRGLIHLLYCILWWHHEATSDDRPIPSRFVQARAVMFTQRWTCVMTSSSGDIVALSKLCLWPENWGWSWGPECGSLDWVELLFPWVPYFLLSLHVGTQKQCPSCSHPLENCVLSCPPTRPTRREQKLSPWEAEGGSHGEADLP